jgi:hypothetical protein
MNRDDKIKPFLMKERTFSEKFEFRKQKLEEMRKNLQ